MGLTLKSYVDIAWDVRGRKVVGGMGCQVPSKTKEAYQFRER